MKLQDYEEIIGAEKVAAIEDLAKKLEGKTIQHINSTVAGGGVAEILKRLVPLMESVGLRVYWDVLEGTPEFFRVTKVFHNALHGRQVEITPEMLDEYRRVNRENQEIIREDADFVIIHDQQPLGLTEVRPGHKGRWIWYCHIDPVDADPGVWNFLRPMVAWCDAAVYHLPEYVKDADKRHYVMPPAIDPLGDKNRDLSDQELDAVLDRLGVPGDLPLLVQVSRFDWLKDPIGVIGAFHLVRQEVPCRVVLAGGGATDDPEGVQVLEAVLREAAGDPDIYVLQLPATSDLEINALQRAAAVIIQKSVREGFGLTVTEGLWKGRPVVACPVGGIKIQVLNEETGLQAFAVEEVASAAIRLLKEPNLARRLGSAGREHVRKNFILPVYLERWLEMLINESRT